MYSEGSRRKKEQKATSNIETGEDNIVKAKRVALFKRQKLIHKVKCYMKRVNKK